MFELRFAADWDQHFAKIDKANQERIRKKIRQLKTLEPVRHLKHGLPFSVVQSGQYRICFREKQNIREIQFVGNHKQYEKWYKKQ